MSSIEPFTPEGIDPNSSYLATCISRVNTNYKLAVAGIIGTIDPVKLGTLIADVDVLKTKQITINVKDYGAKGDGTTNDTSSILSAISAIPTDAGILYFPKGVYIVSNTLLIQNKNTFCIRSDNAVILNNNYNGSTLKLSNCNRVFTDGSLSINAIVGGLAYSVGIEIYQCYSSVFTNLYISGDFNIGLFLLQEGPRASPNPYGLSATVNNCVIRGCRYGLYLGGEYYLINNSLIYFNTVAGIWNDTGGGNNSIDNCSVVFNKVGIYILGQNSTNSDHSKITNCTINHNSACGIYLRNIEYTMQITNNQIWASYGLTMNNIAPLPLPLSSTARSLSFGIYMENVINVNIQGNTLSKSYVNIGLDGWSLCMISNNIFQLNPTNNYGHITEYGENNTRTGTANMANIITNNIFTTDPASSVEYFSFYDSEKTRKYNFKGNRGLTSTNPLLIETVGNYYIGNRDNYVVNAYLGLTSLPPNTPAGVALQTTNIYILPSLIGEEFEITFYNTTLGGSRFIWLRFKTNNTSTAIITVGNGISQHIPTNKAICINTQMCSIVKFTPYGNDGNQWIVSGMGAPLV